MVRAFVITLLVLATTSIADADAIAPVPPPSTTADARLAMEDYFAGEKTGGYVLAGLGVGGLALGGLLYRSSSQTARGASYPLLGLGVLHLAAGIYVYVASTSRIDDFTNEIERDGQAWVERERVRMKGVSTQFTVLKIVEVGLIAGGLTMAGIGWRKDRPRLQGAGLALALEAALTLGFDIWAARRADDYRAELAVLDIARGSTSLSDTPTTLFSHTLQF